uniref:YadA family autotransporter adhesin n=1 Tax=Moraxella oblonga TaxID=200413 RepID=UPI000AA49872
FNSALAYTDNNGNTTDANGKPLAPTNSVKFVGQNPAAPVTVTGATSGLTPQDISTLPNVSNPAVTAPVINFNGGNNANVDGSTVATVGDLRNMGWVVSTSKGNNYSDVVRSSNVVDFVGANGVTVTGETVNGKRVITIAGGGNGGNTVTAGNNVNVTTNTTNHPNGTSSVDYTVNVPTAPITTNANGSVNVPSTSGLANATDVANAINNAGWNAQANGANGTLVKPSDTVSFNNGDNINITKDGNNFTVSTAKDIDVKGNLTVAGNTTLGNINVKPNSTVNMGGNTITNVAPATNGTDAVNLDQLNATKVQVVAGTNVKVDTATKADGSTTYTVHSGVTVNGGSNVYGNLVDGDDTSVKPSANGKGVEVVVNKGNVAPTGKGDVTFNATNGTVATVDQVANAINNSGWDIQGNKVHTTVVEDVATGVQDVANATTTGATNIVKPTTQVNFVDGDGVSATVTKVVDKDGNEVRQDIRFNSPMLYKDKDGNIITGNPNDADNPNAVKSNTVVMKGGEPIQIQEVSSGVRDVVHNYKNIHDAVMDSDRNGTTTNAANIGDIRGVAEGIHNRIDGVVDDANAGISSAMAAASLPQAYLPGKSMLTGGVASYNGEGAVAVGMSKLSDNGRWVLKLHGSADTRGNVGGAVGAGFHF